MRRLRRRGQSTLEYALVLTAIVAAILVAAKGIINPTVNNAITEAGTSMGTAATTLFDETDAQVNAVTSTMPEIN